jgi:hypothetical protein
VPAPHGEQAVAPLAEEEPAAQGLQVPPVPALPAAHAVQPLAPRAPVESVKPVTPWPSVQAMQAELRVAPVVARYVFAGQ